jgi:acyl-CoA dehydrogenase
VIDKGVHIHGGEGVRKGNIAERLYREIRSAAYLPGPSDVRKIIIARQTLANTAEGD